MPAAIEREIEAAVRKALIDEAAAKAIQLVLAIPEGMAMIERIAHEQATDFVRKARTLVSDHEATKVEAALVKTAPPPAGAK